MPAHQQCKLFSYPPPLTPTAIMPIFNYHGIEALRLRFPSHLEYSACPMAPPKVGGNVGHRDVILFPLTNSSSVNPPNLPTEALSAFSCDSAKGGSLQSEGGCVFTLAQVMEIAAAGEGKNYPSMNQDPHISSCGFTKCVLVPGGVDRALANTFVQHSNIGPSLL